MSPRGKIEVVVVVVIVVDDIVAVVVVVVIVVDTKNGGNSSFVGKLEKISSLSVVLKKIGAMTTCQESISQQAVMPYRGSSANKVSITRARCV